MHIYSLVDLHRLTRSRPAGWPRFTLADYLREQRQRLRRRPSGSRRDVGTYYTGVNWWSDVAGTAGTWTSAGGSGFGGAITCTSLGSGSLRQGVKSSITIAVPPNGAASSIPPSYFAVALTVQFTSAPVAGGEVAVYLGFSSNPSAGSNNPGGLSGTDAAGPNVDVLPQLVFCGSLIASNNLGTGVQLSIVGDVANPDPFGSPYICPVIYNNTSVAFNSTAADTILSITPYWRQSST